VIFNKAFFGNHRTKPQNFRGVFSLMTATSKKVFNYYNIGLLTWSGPVRKIWGLIQNTVIAVFESFKRPACSSIDRVLWIEPCPTTSKVISFLGNFEVYKVFLLTHKYNSRFWGITSGLAAINYFLFF
jgi:hypothetical protein